MRILYGVCGEGMGHAVRSAVVARHLQDRGHGVCVASSGGALDYLSRRFASTIRVTGLGIVKEGGRVQGLATAIQNIVRQGIGALGDASSFLDVALSDRPDVIISDFESWSARTALALGIPLLAVDSIHFLSRFRHPRDLVDVDAALTLPVVDAMVPYARHYLVCPLVPGASAPCTQPENTSLHAPILRPEVLRARRDVSAGPHLTVYVNDLAASAITIEVLVRSGLPCHVWGSRGRTNFGGRVEAFVFDEVSFLLDLASCRAVVGSAGALLGEAAVLGKPALALPIGGHWEQRLNGAYHERLGHGESHDELTGEGLSLFLERAPEYARALESLEHDDNRGLLASLDAELARIAS